jgi:hypothetical protein
MKRILFVLFVGTLYWSIQQSVDAFVNDVRKHAPPRAT